MLSFRVPINISNNVSFGMPSTLRLNFWNCWMCLITKPFFLRFINWVKKDLLLTSSWYAINSLVKTYQDMMVFFLHSHSHWYHTNCWGSKYKDAIVTFCKFGPLVYIKELLHLKYPCDGVLAIKLPHVNIGELNTPCGPSLITSCIRIKSSKAMLINGW